MSNDSDSTRRGANTGGQLAKYATAGVSAFLIEYCIYLALTYTAGIHYIVSHAASRCVSVVFHFLVTRHLVFGPRSTMAREAAKYLATAVSVLLATTGLLYCLVEYLDIGRAIAKPAAGAVMFFVSFTVLKTVVFAGKASSSTN